MIHYSCTRCGKDTTDPIKSNKDEAKFLSFNLWNEAATKGETQICRSCGDELRALMKLWQNKDEKLEPLIKSVVQYTHINASDGVPRGRIGKSSGGKSSSGYGPPKGKARPHGGPPSKH
jgi:DNA-directed RNA polymerase subunit RPC12/RpoP